MEKKRTFKTLLAAVLVVLAAVFALTACDEGGVPDVPPLEETNYAELVAGTYKSVEIDYGERTVTTLTIEEDGDVVMETCTDDGVESSTSTIKMHIVVDEDKNVTDVKLVDLDDYKSLDYVFGTLLENDSADMMLEIKLILGMLGDSLTDFIDFKFGDDYVVMDSSGTPSVLYKDGAKRLAYDTVYAFMTEKEYTVKEISLSSLMRYGSMIAPSFDGDYYLIKNDAFDLTKAEDKAGLLETLSDLSLAVKVDHLGYLEYSGVEIVDASGFDLATVGTRSGVIKYKSAGVTVEKTVTYTVIEDREVEHPLYQASEARYNSIFYDVEYVQKDAELYNLGWKITYELFTRNDSDNVTVSINEENCTGDTKIVDIIGYDKTKTGLQTVGIKFRGYEKKITVFVYDETVNPVISMSLVSKSTGSTPEVLVKKNGESYTLDCSDLQFKTKKADGTYANVDVAATDAIETYALKDYEDGDYIYFVYKETFDGKEYCFYDRVKCKVVDVTPESGE